MTQIISYPLLLKVKKSNFSYYYNSYTRRISIIVVPLMIFEVLFSIAINITFDNAYIAASNIFVHSELSTIAAKAQLLRDGINVRLSSSVKYDEFEFDEFGRPY